MPKYILYLFLMLVIFPSSTFAKVEVNISDNLDGSSSKVNIDSDTLNSYQSSKVNNHTDIVIENNGERKEYHGSDGNIDIQSSDGKSSVKVNTTGATNNEITNSTSNITSTTNITVKSNTSPSATPEATVAGVFMDNSEGEKKGFWEYLKKQISQLLELFS